MYNIKDLEFPKAKTLNTARLRMPVLVEEKLDGWRMTIWKEHAYGRSVDSLGYWRNRWEQLPPYLQEMDWPEPVDGEIYLLNADATDVPTALKQHDPDLLFKGFRLPCQDLEPLEHLTQIANYGIKTPQVLIYQPHSAYFPLAEIQETKFLEIAAAWKIEGWLLKEKFTVPTWWKLKLKETYDLVVEALKMPTAGRNFQHGWIKSLVCSAYVKGERKIVANVSGMNDKIRAAITEKDIGRVVEVKANLLASKGRLKHPQFLRWRDDKNENECKI